MWASDLSDVTVRYEFRNVKQRHGVYFVSTSSLFHDAHMYICGDVNRTTNSITGCKIPTHSQSKHLDLDRT